jgi:hypothetical protein
MQNKRAKNAIVRNQDAKKRSANDFSRVQQQYTCRSLRSFKNQTAEFEFIKKTIQERGRAHLYAIHC